MRISIGHPPRTESKRFPFSWIYEPEDLPFLTEREVIEFTHDSFTKEAISEGVTILATSGFSHRVVSAIKYAAVSAETGESSDSKLYFYLEYGHPERIFSHDPWATLEDRVSIRVEDEIFVADLLESRYDVYGYWDWTLCISGLPVIYDGVCEVATLEIMGSNLQPLTQLKRVDPIDYVGLDSRF